MPIYSEKDVLILKKGGRRLAKIIRILETELRVGISGKYIDELTRTLMVKSGGRPSFLNYEGYPASICLSINDEVVHSIPDSRRFKNGDLVGIDAGLYYQGMHTDMAVTKIIGYSNKETKHFTATAKKALGLAIREAKPGNSVGHISQAIQNFVEKNGYNVVREMNGHGIGRRLHEEPIVPNCGVKGTGQVLKKGMVMAIEPIINMGGREIETSIDGWGVKTKDKSLSAHFEHTIVITDGGSEILTAAP